MYSNGNPIEALFCVLSKFIIDMPDRAHIDNADDDHDIHKGIRSKRTGMP